jgi:ubiquitin-protein ligase E3 C
VIESYACCILLKLRTGADEDDDMPMDVDVKGGLDIDLQKQITAAFDSNTRLLDHLVC